MRCSAVTWNAQDYGPAAPASGTLTSVELQGAALPTLDGRTRGVSGDAEPRLAGLRRFVAECLLHKLVVSNVSGPELRLEVSIDCAGGCVHGCAVMLRVPEGACVPDPGVELVRRKGRSVGRQPDQDSAVCDQADDVLDALGESLGPAHPDAPVAAGR